MNSEKETNTSDLHDEQSRAAMSATVGSSYIQGGIKRTVLEKTEFNDDLTVNFNLIEVPNGTSAAPHTHPGLEVTYVLEGEFDLVTEGRPDRRFVPGMTYMVADGDIHYARVIGSQPIKLLCLFLHDKTKPVAIVHHRSGA